MAAAQGLLQKARAYLETHTHTLTRQDAGGGGATGVIRESDRARINEEIDREVAGARTPVTPERLAFTPKRRGAVLPIVVNLVALVVVAAGILGAVWLSRQREQAAAAAPATIATAEGKLLKALKQESEEQLASKDREISDIRGKLAGLDEERQRLAAESEARVRAREQELLDSVAATLETERAKLEASGLSEDAVTARLAALETKARADADRTLAGFRQQAEVDRAAQEQAAEQLRTEYRQSLAQAQADRSRIQEEAAARQTELEAGYRQKELQLQQDKAAALAELGELRRAQEKESLVLDQFVSFYREVRDDIGDGNPDEATAALARFRAYLDDPSVAALPAISRRRPVELFLISSLEEIAQARRAEAEDSAAQQSLVASASLVAAVGGLVQQADALFADRDYTRARELYLSALAKIPAVHAGAGRLAEIEQIYADQGRREVAGILAEGNAAYLAGDTDRAAARYRRALEALAADKGTVDTLVSQLEEIGAIRERAAAAAERQAAAAESARDAAADEQARAALLAELSAATGEIQRLRTETENAAAEREAAAAAREAAGAAERDTAIAERDAALSERDSAAAARDTAIAERDQARFTLATEQDRRTMSLAGLVAFRERAGQAAAPEADSRESVLSLVQTKVLVQKVLLSDAVLAEYPDLADRLDRYLEALVVQSRGEGELEALRDLDSVLGSLAAGKGAEVSDELLGRHAGAGQQELLLGILDKLTTMLR